MLIHAHNFWLDFYLAVLSVEIEIRRSSMRDVQTIRGSKR